MLEYFGRNTFIMNILQTWTTRKLLNTRYLRAGNRGGTPLIVKRLIRGIVVPARKLRIDVDDLWYKNAVIYCLSVATYMDGDGDGVGDFRG